ncbi:MAG TPA: lysophospholipid acyltransferase family protein [Fluviicoccus sp.]|nr:lysophospholipid acyltransferase family protein [Fluviicoccus sp.]
MSAVKSSVGRLRVAGRITRLGAHIGTGFVLGVASGALFVQHLPFQRPVIRYWHRRMCQVLNLQVRVHGEPDPRPALWVSNHVSWMDIPVIGAHFPVSFLSKAEVADWPIVGHLARAAGTLYIKRGSGDANSVSSQMASHLQAGRSVLFFPEGTTTDGRQLKTFFHKLFQAACVTGADIQPVVLCYRDEQGELHSVAPFIGDDEFTDHLMKVLKEKPMQVELLVLPRVSVDGRDARALSKHLRQLMAEGLERLHRGETAGTGN